MKHDKLRDMVRSILPSKRRQRAREAKAMTRRWARRVARQDLRVADFETAGLDRDADQSGNVGQRRSADKLNHFMRWADSLTEGMSDYEALQHIRAILPKNLIGDHAYGHWEQHIEARQRIRRLEQERGRLVRSARASRPGTVWPASETLPGCGRDIRAPFSDLLRPLAAAA